MKTEDLYRDIIDNLEDGIYFVDQERRFTMWNRAAEKITGYTAKEILGFRCQDNILDHIDMDGKPLCLLGCPLFDTLGDGELRSAEVLLRHKDGHRVAVLVKILPIYNEGKIVGAAEIFTPRTTVAGDSQIVDALTDKVMTDMLTGLPNRFFLENFLGYKMKEFKRFGSRYAVLFMDIDNFRNFNNHYGHHVGDKVLTSIANSLSGNTRHIDTIGRWGGEEFLGVFAIHNDKEAHTVGEQVRTLVKGSAVLHEGQRLSVTASIGVAIGQKGDTLESVVERADKLMYCSKENGKDQVTVEKPPKRSEMVVTDLASIKK